MIEWKMTISFTHRTQKVGGLERLALNWFLVSFMIVYSTFYPPVKPRACLLPLDKKILLLVSSGGEDFMPVIQFKINLVARNKVSIIPTTLSPTVINKMRVAVASSPLRYSNTFNHHSIFESFGEDNAAEESVSPVRSNLI